MGLVRLLRMALALLLLTRHLLLPRRLRRLPPASVVHQLAEKEAVPRSLQRHPHLPMTIDARLVPNVVWSVEMKLEVFMLLRSTTAAVLKR